jgi:hypothetical protein
MASITPTILFGFFHNHKIFKDSVPNGTYRVHSQVLKIDFSNSGQKICRNP